MSKSTDLSEEFKILYFNYVFEKSNPTDPQWFYLNLIIEPKSSYLKSCLEQDSKNLHKVYCYTDLDKYQKYIKGDLTLSQLEKFITAGWVSSTPFIDQLFLKSKNLKLNKFRFHEYFQVNPMTLGALGILSNMKQGTYTSKGNSSPGSQLMSLLESLKPWWD